MEHGVEVVAVMAAGTGDGSGVRSDALLAFLFMLFGFGALLLSILKNYIDIVHSS